MDTGYIVVYKKVRKREQHTTPYSNREDAEGFARWIREHNANATAHVVEVPMGKGYFHYGKNPSNQITIPASRVIINPGKSISILAPKGTATRLMGTLKRIGKVTRRKVAGLGKGIRNFKMFGSHIYSYEPNKSAAESVARSFSSSPGSNFSSGSLKAKKIDGRWAVVGDSRNPGRRSSQSKHIPWATFNYKSDAVAMKDKLREEQSWTTRIVKQRDGKYAVYVAGKRRSNPSRRKGRRNPTLPALSGWSKAPDPNYGNRLEYWVTTDVGEYRLLPRNKVRGEAVYSAWRGNTFISNHRTASQAAKAARAHYNWYIKTKG